MDDLWCVWAVMTNKVYGKAQNQPKPLPDLKRRITKAWKSLDSKLLRKAVHKMALRVKELVRKKEVELVALDNTLNVDYV